MTSYQKQPADYLLQYFDMVQLGDDFSWEGSNFRRRPPLLEHAGNVSTRDAVERREHVKASRRFDDFKDANPR